MSENVFYETKQLRVTDKLLRLSDNTTLSIASISSVILRIVPRGGLLGLLFGDRTARLFIELNTGIVHELASEDIPEIEKMKAAIEKAIASRLSGGIMCMSDRPTKITFGDMRDMGVRGILVSGR